MRASVLVVMVVSLAAAGAFGSSAFNYVSLQARNVIADVVTDDNGYLAIATQDAQYACYVAYTNGVIDVTWDGGSSCTAGATGTGVNAQSTYYFHDVLKFTNKGTKTLTHLWLNMTDAVVQTQAQTATGAMTTNQAYSTNQDLTTNLAPGNSWYIGFKIDASAKDTTNTPLSKTMTIAARSTG